MVKTAQLKKGNSKKCVGSFFHLYAEQMYMLAHTWTTYSPGHHGAPLQKIK